MIFCSNKFKSSIVGMILCSALILNDVILKRRIAKLEENKMDRKKKQDKKKMIIKGCINSNNLKIRS